MNKHQLKQLQNGIILQVYKYDRTITEIFIPQENIQLYYKVIDGKEIRIPIITLTQTLEPIVIESNKTKNQWQ